MEHISELRGMIYRKYSSEAALAREIGWTKQRMSKITRGLQEPTLTDVELLAVKLDQPFEVMANIFLRHKSPNGPLPA